MRRDQIHKPDDWASVDGKIRVITESLDGLLAGSTRFGRDHDVTELLATIVASVVVLHQVVEAMLEDER